jgi:monoamine oxidase
VAAPKLEGGVLLLQVSPGPQADQRVVSVSVQAPVGLRAGGEPAVRALVAQVHEALQRVMPFTKQHVTLESIPWIDAPHVVAGRGEVAPLFQPGPEAWLGATGHTTSSPWKRVMLASRQVLPGLGFEGEVLAAQRAVKKVELALHKNDPLKRKTS